MGFNYKTLLLFHFSSILVYFEVVTNNAIQICFSRFVLLLTILWFDRHLCYLLQERLFLYDNLLCLLCCLEHSICLPSALVTSVLIYGCKIYTNYIYKHYLHIFFKVCFYLYNNK